MQYVTDSFQSRTFAYALVFTVYIRAYHINNACILHIFCTIGHLLQLISIYCIDILGGVDYEPGPYSIMFPAGQTNATFSVSVMDDEVSEGNEYFNLAIDVSSLPIEVNASNPADVLVTIVDDEGK